MLSDTPNSPISDTRIPHYGRETPWMVDHDTDSYEKISRAFLDGQPAGHHPRGRIVDKSLFTG